MLKSPLLPGVDKLQAKCGLQSQTLRGASSSEYTLLETVIRKIFVVKDNNYAYKN